MRTIIAGSRDITDMRLLERAIRESGLVITEVVCGGARGVDQLGYEWAHHGNNIPVKLFPANWDKYGKGAGYRRNIEMAKYADALIAIWDGKSKGTKHMIDIAIEYKLKVIVYEVQYNEAGQIMSILIH